MCNGASIYFAYNRTIVNDEKAGEKTCDLADGVREWMDECARNGETVEGSQKKLGGVMSGFRFHEVQCGG